jgi:ribonuclease P protein component
MRTGRVRTRGEFAALRQRGSRSRQRSVRLLHLADGAPGARVAFAVGRPVGTAVVRNRLRRQLRAALRELEPADGLYLVTVHPSAARQSYSDLQAELSSALTEVGAR